MLPSTYLDDSVCGVSVSTRYMSDNFQIWTANAAGKNEEKVKDRLTQVLSPIEVQSMYYKGKSLGTCTATRRFPGVTNLNGVRYLDRTHAKLSRNQFIEQSRLTSSVSHQKQSSFLTYA